MDKDIGYLTGLIDSEGCLCFRNDKGRLRGLIKIAMKDTRPLKFAAEIIRQIVGKKPKLSYCKSNDSYSIAVSGKNAIIRLLQRIRKHLVTKQEEAWLLLHGLRFNDPEVVDLLKWTKRNPEPSRIAEGAETRRGALSDYETGWLAGMIDGDGFVGTHPPEIKLELSHRRGVNYYTSLIERLCSDYKCHVRTRHFKNPKWRDVCVTRTRKRSVIDRIVEATYSHLLEKRERALGAAVANRHKERVQKS